MNRDRHDAFFDLAEGLAESASPDSMSRWILGVGAALATAGYGLYCVLMQHAWVPRTRPLGLHEWTGDKAVAVGCIFVAAAAFIHCHWFWSSHPQWHGYGQFGKLLALAGVVSSIAWLLALALVWS